MPAKSPNIGTFQIMWLESPPKEIAQEVLSLSIIEYLQIMEFAIQADIEASEEVPAYNAHSRMNDFLFAHSIIHGCTFADSQCLNEQKPFNLRDLVTAFQRTRTMVGGSPLYEAKKYLLTLESPRFQSWTQLHEAILSWCTKSVVSAKGKKPTEIKSSRESGVTNSDLAKITQIVADKVRKTRHFYLTLQVRKTLSFKRVCELPEVQALELPNGPLKGRWNRGFKDELKFECERIINKKRT